MEAFQAVREGVKATALHIRVAGGVAVFSPYTGWHSTRHPTESARPLREGGNRLRECRDLPRVTQLVDSRARAWTRVKLKTGILCFVYFL